MRITILMHEKDPSLDFYLLGEICDVWCSQGHQIIEQHGLSRPVEGDLVFLHVDLTVVPDEYLEAVEHHPRVVNRGAVDISKTQLSRIQVRSRDEWDGPVIVKTVRNHGGHPERRIRRGTALGRIQNGMDKIRSLSLAHARHLDPHCYPVFESARDVPRGVFSNPALIVERFVPERRGETSCVRVLSFLGERVCNQVRCSLDRVPTIDDRLVWTEEPAHCDIMPIARGLGFDYGRFDYVVQDDRAILLDANRTVVRSVTPDIYGPRVSALVPALESLLR